MVKETLEEASLKVAHMLGTKDSFEYVKMSFELGAKWQQERMYSEEEVRQLLEYAIHESRMQDDKTEYYILKDALEQFKKK